jgi:hypothetical protein
MGNDIHVYDPFNDREIALIEDVEIYTRGALDDTYQFIAVSDVDSNEVRVVNIATGLTLQTFKTNEFPYAIDWAGNLLAVSMPNEVMIFDVVDGKLLKTFLIPYPSPVSWNEDATLLFLQNRSNQLYSIDLETGVINEKYTSQRCP